ncbi:chromosome partitioning protein ParB (plasmid) [Burkholderia ubonensis]|uniref:plasmid partition protein ParG n=1 Tax=Burkholderia ubonensis TaxID=101571 RepID=UPI000841423C|nr:plasmid partition protein ParG [Burkholderia ubonensis]AOK57671.1 chromosome partitioning protein ParB [Burkholderia ubonensis]
MSKLNLSAGRPSATRNKAATLASLAEDAGLKRVNFQVPPELHMKLKIYAARHGKTITEVLTEYVANLPDE